PRASAAAGATAAASRRLLAQRIAGAADGLDQTLLIISLQLVAQSPDVDLDRVTLDHGITPDSIQDLIAHEHLARMAHEQEQQLVLAGGQIDPSAAAFGLACAGVEAQVGERQDFFALRLRSSQQRA